MLTPGNRDQIVDEPNLESNEQRREKRITDLLVLVTDLRQQVTKLEQELLSVYRKLHGWGFDPK